MARSYDVSMQKLVGISTKLITITAKLLDKVAKKSKEGGQLTIEEVQPLLTDLLRLGAALFTDLNQRRRSAIKPHLRNNFKKLCKPQTYTSNEFLFGDSLSEEVKNIGDTMKLCHQVAPFNRSDFQSNFHRGKEQSKNGPGRRLPPASTAQFRRGVVAHGTHADTTEEAVGR